MYPTQLVKDPVYRTVKTYGHERGLSCCFRQHPATHSHCSKLHGYSLAVELTFEAYGLDHRNWVMDFGGLKPVEQFLKDTFDHKTVVAEDDPELQLFFKLEDRGVVDLTILSAVGCEAFAEYIHNRVCLLLGLDDESSVRLAKVKVMEHGSNAAEFELHYGIAGSLEVMGEQDDT